MIENVIPLIHVLRQLREQLQAIGAGRTLSKNIPEGMF
jgi:hypothetical protein